MKILKAVLAALLAASAAGAARHDSPQTDGTANHPPVVKLKAPNHIIIAAKCREGEPLNPTCTKIEPVFTISGAASDPDGDTLKFNFSTTGGRLSGSGQNVTLDLRGVAPGVYTVTVEVDDGRGGVVVDSARVSVGRCQCPARTFIPLPCPTVTVSCPSAPLKPGTPITFTANVSGGGPYVTPTFEWTVSSGTITGGQGTSSITVNNSGAPPGGGLTAAVEVGGFDRSCSTSTSCTTGFWDPPVARKVDEYGAIPFGDEKARLDNFYEELRNDPAAQGYLVCYGGRRSRAGEAERRCYRARDYLVPTRGINASRVVTVDGGLREEPTTEFWLVPSGATPPFASPTVKPPAVQAAPQGRRGVRRSRRRH